MKKLYLLSTALLMAAAAHAEVITKTFNPLDLNKTDVTHDTHRAGIAFNGEALGDDIDFYLYQGSSTSTVGTFGAQYDMVTGQVLLVEAHEGFALQSITLSYGRYSADITFYDGTDAIQTSKTTWTASERTTSVYGRFGNRYRIASVTIAYEAVNQAVIKPTLSRESSICFAPFTLTAACDTEDASLLVAIDSDEFDVLPAEGLLIDHSCAVKVKATKPDFDDSPTVEAVYDFFTDYTVVTSIAEALAVEENTAVRFDGQATVIYQTDDCNHTWLYDSTGYIYLYGKIPAALPGDILADGFIVRMTNPVTGPRMETVIDPSVSPAVRSTESFAGIAGQGTPLEPTECKTSAFSKQTLTYCQYVVINDAVYETNTGQGTFSNGIAVDVQNLLTLTLPADGTEELTVVGFVGQYGIGTPELQLIPISWEQKTTSAIDIDAPQSVDHVQYFNLQGQPVANPASGLYIRRSATGAAKVYIP